MGHSFHADTDQLRQHASAVDGVTTRADTAAGAGRQVAGMDNAYGLYQHIDGAAASNLAKIGAAE